MAQEAREELAKQEAREVSAVEEAREASAVQDAARAAGVYNTRVRNSLRGQDKGGAAGVCAAHTQQKATTITASATPTLGFPCPAVHGILGLETL